MKKIFLGASTLLVLLSGCSNNELLDGQNSIQNDGKVRFAATTNRTISRAATNNPITGAAGLQDNVKEFKVKGYVGSDESALVDATVNWTGASWEYDDEPYWPDATINFFAYANWGTAPTIDKDGITSSVTIAQDKMEADGQKDLLVAAVKDATKGSGGNVRTTLTFKHALTQIVFKAGNLDNTKLQVRIGGLRIVNVSASGDVTVTAEAVTGAKIAWANNTTTQATKYYVQGLQTTNESTFGATDVVASEAYTVGKVETTTAYTEYGQVKLASATGSNALMLVPQTFDAWNPNDSEKPTGASGGTTKAYIELLAIINDPTKVSTGEKVGEAAYYYCGTPAQGADGTADKYGKIYIPIESKDADANEWIPGKRISYIITFGDKGSGSGGGGYDEDNEPILVPIKFNAVVEDWVDVDIPLLTASFSATSDDIKAGFIDGFTTQLLNDIAAAKEIKTYRANIKISGELKESATISFGTTSNDNIATGSTVTYDFVGITTWASTKTISMTVPTGWKAETYLASAPTTVVETVAAGSSVPVDGTTANKIVLTRVETPIP